jgi:hypothetical protein
MPPIRLSSMCVGCGRTSVAREGREALTCCDASRHHIRNKEAVALRIAEMRPLDQESLHTPAP